MLVVLALRQTGKVAVLAQLSARRIVIRMKIGAAGPHGSALDVNLERPRMVQRTSASRGKSDGHVGCMV
jgi:hypothetical protein